MIHVFVGPTLAPGTVRRLLPDAIVQPPIRYGDLDRIGLEAGDVAAIVDGFFHQVPAVRHKEILAALDAGVRVYGAASMGALRAAELHTFGMIGVGEIYELLVAGTLEGDDEVAVLHADAEDGYRRLSEALVDVRLHCREARDAGALDEAGEEAIVAAARALSFDQRFYPRILADALERGLTSEGSRGYRDFVTRHGQSAKERDALALLDRLRAPSPPDERPRFELANTRWLYGWGELRAGWRDASGVFATDRIVLDLVRIAAREYPQFHERVALEELAALYAEHSGVSPLGADALLDELRTELGLEDDPALRAWLEARHMTRAELLASLVRRSRVRALVGSTDAVPLAELARLVCDYAVELGIWARGSPPNAALAAWLDRDEVERLTATQRVARVAVRTFELFPSLSPRAPFVQELKLSGAYARARRLVVERQPIPGARPPSAQVLAWCAARWGIPQITAFDVLDRGLAVVDNFAAGLPVARGLVNQARPLYARVLESGDYPPVAVDG